MSYFSRMVYPLTIDGSARAPRRRRLCAWSARSACCFRASPRSRSLGLPAALGRHDGKRASLFTGPDGMHHAICKGCSDFASCSFWKLSVPARVSTHRGAEKVDADIEGRAHNLKQRAIEILQLLPQVPERCSPRAKRGGPRGSPIHRRSDDISAEDKQALLETFDLKARLDKLLELLSRASKAEGVARDR